MFQKIMDDIRNNAGEALRLSSFAVIGAICLLVTVSFLCAAAFVYVLQTYGLLQACLAGAALFFVASVLAAMCYAISKRQAAARARQEQAAASSTFQAALADPMVLAAGLQLVRSVGLKRIIPLVALGGIALGLIAGRRPESESTDKKS